MKWIFVGVCRNEASAEDYKLFLFFVGLQLVLEKNKMCLQFGWVI
jgi:hypothetical protein